MTGNGDDCYFFYYSTCTKGDSCPFRHCPAAMGNETVCNLWQEGRCFRTVCKFRHMEITKNRGKIPCYWENQPAGCQKPHCAFLHEKARYIDGIFVPPDKGLGNNEEEPVEETPPPSTATIPTATNLQLRGVMKAETQELVPSPTHPPVVINPADDDEDEDDQFSEEGDDSKGGSTPRKQSKFDGALNFGVRTLEEIRLRKALKASMRRAGHSGQSTDSLASGGKENVLSFCHPAVIEARDETERSSRSVAERLGRKMPDRDQGGGGDVQLKRSLSARLGGVVNDEEALMPPLIASKPVRERLGSKPALVPAHLESKKVPEQIHIKTLEEIRKEKAANSQPESPNKVTSACSASTKATVTKASRGVKRSITVKEDSTTGVKTFSEILRAKKKKQEEEQEQNSSSTKTKHSGKGKNREQPNATVSGPVTANIGGVRVKTLEEIRMEKAARMQAQQTTVAENKRIPNDEDGCAEKTSQSSKNKPDPKKGTTEKRAEVTAKKPKIHSVSDAAQPTSLISTTNIKVKTFEEIMREKRLRRQEMEGAKKNSSGTDPSESQDPDSSGDQTAPDVNSHSSPDRVSPSSQVMTTDTTPPVQKFPARQLAPLKSKGTSPPSSIVSSVRPKLNVKPVMKPAVQVNPGLKRKGTDKSATAAVKPLKSSCTELVEPTQESSSQVLPSPNTAVPHCPNTQLDLSSSQSPMREEPQTVPVISLSQDTKPVISVASSQEACEVPQSPIPKTSTQPKARRHSAISSRTATSSRAASTTVAMDDFDDLINEFTDEQLEDDMDPGIGEDDLLQELSEMIDS